MSETQSPKKDDDPYKIDTIEEPCYGCGVVQRMVVYERRYQRRHPATQYPKGECPVCENDHAKNPPW